MTCGGWEFEMGTYTKACRCRENYRGRDNTVAMAFVEQVGRRWSVVLSTRPTKHSSWKQAKAHFSPTRAIAQKYATEQLRAHLKRVCKK